MSRTEVAAIVAAVLPIVGYGAVQLVGQGAYFLPLAHFVAVFGAAVAAGSISAGITRAAARRQDLRAGFTGIGFAVMAGLLMIHGLATPGVFVARDDIYPVVGTSGALAVPLGGLLLLLALWARPAVNPRRLIIRAQVVTVSALIGFGAISLLKPDSVHGLPTHIAPWMLTLLIPTVAAYGWMAWVAFRTFRLTRRTSDLEAAVGMVWLGASSPIYLTSIVWSAGFWLAHAAEVFGFLAVAHAVIADLSETVPSFQLSRRVGSRELVESEHELLGSHVRAMTATLHERDPSTAQHSRRVAGLAMRVADELRLPAGALRRLAIAGLVHDIGKLAVPAEILNKPGRLSDEEYAVIKTHPQAGADILATVRGFAAEIPIVRAHHERVDGAGYPHGLRGDEIPIEARILAVCDVYDALTSTRPYREAWPAERALDLITKESGTAFDAACVEALGRAIGRLAAGELDQAA